MQQSVDSQRNLSLPHDMITLKSNTHIAFIQRDMITYPIPLKYLREDNFQQQYIPPSNENSYYPQQSRHQHNNRMYQT